GRMTIASGGVTKTLAMSSVTAAGFAVIADGFGGSEFEAASPPTLTGTANASFTEKGSSVTLSPSVTISDTSSTTLVGATVAIAGGTFANDGDVLAATTSGTSITASYNSSTE